jgi:hypothetical protein
MILLRSLPYTPLQTILLLSCAFLTQTLSFSQPSMTKITALSMNNSKEGDDSSSHIKLLGVCGGIGSGKSTACKLLVSEVDCAAYIGR